MISKDSVVLLRTAVINDKDHVRILLSENPSILCINKSTKKDHALPFKALYENNNSFWLQNGSWEYFLSNEDFAIMKEKVEAEKSAKGFQLPEFGPAERVPAPPEGKTAGGQSSPAASGFGKEYDGIAAMPLTERLMLILEDKRRLDTLIAQKPKQEEAVTSALVNTTRNTALVNQVTLMDAMQMADDEAKKYTQYLVDSTHALVKSSSQLVSPNIFNDELMSTLVAKSNGTIIQHMTRVFINGIAFLSYYNNLVSTSSLINKLRICFEKKYRDYYQTLLPHVGLGAIILERVFIGGMRAIPEPQFFDWAVGFMLHDIGKAAAVEYHEGEAAYNRDIVVEHVKLGYTSVMNKTNYSLDAALITGYHHEYYGDSSGYGYFRYCLEQHKKTNPHANQDFCISYDIKPVVDYQTLAFFPAKVLEIIDVYDSVTDPNRKYRRALSSEEALAMMREEFIEKHLKIDPILFDIFAAFVREREAAKAT